MQGSTRCYSIDCLARNAAARPSLRAITCISHRLTGEAGDTTAMWGEMQVKAARTPLPS